MSGRDRFHSQPPNYALILAKGIHQISKKNEADCSKSKTLQFYQNAPLLRRPLPVTVSQSDCAPFGSAWLFNAFLLFRRILHGHADPSLSLPISDSQKQPNSSTEQQHKRILTSKLLITKLSVCFFICLLHLYLHRSLINVYLVCSLCLWSSATEPWRGNAEGFFSTECCGRAQRGRTALSKTCTRPSQNFKVRPMAQDGSHYSLKQMIIL